jgi:hypothetical protein
MSANQGPESGTPQAAQGEARPEPTFGSLLRGNLKVLAWVFALGLLAFGGWYGLAQLFPEVSWLRVPAR